MSIALATSPVRTASEGLTRAQSVSFGALSLSIAAGMFGLASCLASIPGASVLMVALSAGYGLLGGRLLLLRRC